MSALVDAEARRRIREDLDASFVVEAAAGTGKTTALVSRIVALVRTGRAELSGIVAVTFTEAAAGEMKLRLRAALERERNAEHPDERVRLDRALAQLEEARITTIHSLCVDLLRERPVEAGVDPLFQVSPEDDARRLFDQAFELWFQRALEDPPEGVRRILRRRRRSKSAASPRDTLREAAFKLLDHRDFAAPWRRDPFDRHAAIDAVVAALETEAVLADQADRAEDWVRKIFVKVQTFVVELQRREALRPRDYDGLESELATLAKDYDWRYRYGGQWYRKGQLTRAEVLDRKDRLKAQLDRVVAQCEADLAAALHAELTPLVHAFESLAARSGKLDFLDLLLRARDLLEGSAEVRQELQRRFTHVFVDEFQDTDPLQAEILLLLSADDPTERDWTRVVPRRGKLFLVGDPKQSIYRFRRADVALYEQVKRRVVAHGAEVLHLVSSFRGAPSIQEAVNAAFALQMIGNPQGTQADYVPLAPVRTDPPKQPAVVALPVPRPYADYGKIAKKAIDASLPDAVGAFVEWLVRHSGFRVSERERPDELVPVAARHVCLLFKRLQSWSHDTTRPYVRALEARGIPHVLVGGRSFHAREEVAAVRAVLTAIEWPDDELSVFATLRGPFFALGDDALLAFAAARKGSAPFHPLRPVEAPLPAQAEPVAAALAILAELHRKRNRRPIADTIGRFLEATRAHAGVAIWPTGEQSLANVLRLVDLARRFESAGATSFRAFVESLEDAAARGAASDAPVVEEGTDGVRVMTVHKAKGLEFPVVVLVDPTAPVSHDEPTHHVDHARGLWVQRIAGCAPVELLEERDEVLRREREEGIRLAYVAATRARDLLVVPVVGDPWPKQDGWLDVLMPALQPSDADRLVSRPAPGCPKFGGDSVLERPPNAQVAVDDAVSPGEHVPAAGRHRVTWWDPRALDLGREIDVGIRQQAILHADEADLVATQSAAQASREHDAWQARRARVVELGSVPTLRATSATALAHAPGDKPLLPGAPILLEHVEGDRTGHPRGKRFGALVHAVLAAVAFHAPESAAAICEAHGRLLGATPDEIRAAHTRVLRALAHPLMQRARGARCRREVSMTLRREDGSVVDGVIDLAFRAPTDATWTVVDFKTDAELDESARAAYEVQLRLYMAAIREATGVDARGVLLSV